MPEATKKPVMPSIHGLHVFAKREGLWESTEKALKQGGDDALHAIRNLLTVYHQHLKHSLEDATSAVDQIPELALKHYVKSMEEYVSHETQPRTAKLANHPSAGYFRQEGTNVVARVDENPSLSLTAKLNDGAEKMGFGRPFRVTADRKILCNGEPVVAGVSVVVGSVGASKTAASYPELVEDRGGDPSGVKKALEAAVKALNEANVAGLKFDTRIAKLERDTYALFGEYLEHHRRAEAQKVQEDAEREQQAAAPKTSAANLPNAKGDEDRRVFVVTIGGSTNPEDDSKYITGVLNVLTYLFNFYGWDLSNSKRADKIYDQIAAIQPNKHVVNEDMGLIIKRHDSGASDGPAVQDPDSPFFLKQASEELPDGGDRAEDLTTDEERIAEAVKENAKAMGITASHDVNGMDDKILQAVRTKSLNQARQDYINGNMSQDVFDVFVPLWEALHLDRGPELLKGALDRGDISQHFYDLGQKLLDEKLQKQK